MLLPLSAVRRAGARHATTYVRSCRRDGFVKNSSSIITRRSGVIHPTLLRLKNIPVSYYTTERILQAKTGLAKADQPKTLYTPSRETENCGVGMVASLKSVASRKIVNEADEMMIRMSHRGGVGCCPASGDGAGK